MSLVNIIKDFVLFIPCIIDNKIHDSKPTKCTQLFHFYYITLNILTRFCPQGTDTRKLSKVIQHKTIQSLLHMADVVPHC